MRKRETVAHGTTGTAREAQAIVDERLPQLVELLAGLEALFVSARVVVPLQRPANEAPQRAWLLHGPTTWRGEWRSVELAAHATPGKPVIVDPQGTVRLVLDPAVICERASPDVPEDLFFFDGRRKRSAAFVAFPSLAEVWREDVLERLGLAVEESDGDEATSKRAPFRGLASFDRRDAAFFVGREKLVEQLTNRVSSSSWVTVTGASGSGKTSLLAAGVDPALRARVEREGYRQGDDAVYAIVLFRPGDEPLQVLAMELDERLGLTLDRESPSSWARQILDWCAARRRVLVLMVDQAEELVTRCKDTDRREAFGALLAELTASVDLPVRVVFSLRVDFMARVATIRSLADRYQHVTQVVTTPAREDLVRILVEPAARFGVRWEEGLAEEIARTVEDEDSALPLLSYVASRLWDERGESDVLTREAYEALGGVKGALAAHAEKVVARWTEAQRRVARAMLLRLVTADWTRDVVPRAELEEIGGEATDAILGTLERERLVVARTEAREGEGERQVVELAHESLLEHWHQLREWRDEDVEAELHHARLRGATREWLARGRAVHALWGREKLAEHAAVRARRGDALVLTADETAFVQASDRAVRRRRRIAIGTTTAVTLVVAGFAVFAGLQWRAAVASERVATTARDEANEARDEAERRAVMLEARALAAAAHAADLDSHAVVLLGAAATLGPEAEAEALRHGLAVREKRPLPRILQRSSGYVDTLAYAPDSFTLLTSGDRVVLWDVRGGTPRAELAGHRDRVVAAAFSPDSSVVVTGSLDDCALTWDVATGRKRAEVCHDGDVLAASYAPNGRAFATASSDGTVRIWDTQTADLVRILSGHADRVVSVAFSNDGQLLLSASWDGTVKLWHAESGALRHTVRYPRRVLKATFSGSGSSVLILSDDGIARLWTPSSGAIVNLRAGDSNISTARLSVDGTHAVTGGSAARLWDVHTGRVLQHLTEEPTDVLAIAPTGRIAVLSYAGQNHAGQNTVLWHLDSRFALASLTASNARTSSAEFSPDGRTAVTASEDGTIAIWDASIGTGRSRIFERRSHDFYEIHSARIAYDSDSAIAAEVGLDGSVWSWDRGGRRQLVEAPHGDSPRRWAAGYRSMASVVEVSSACNIIAVGFENGTVRVFELSSANQILSWRFGEREIQDILLLGDCSELIVSSSAGSTWVADMTTGLERLAIETHGSGAVRVDAIRGDLMASASRGGALSLWRLVDGSLVAEHRDSAQHFTSLVMIDEFRVVLGAGDGGVYIWDTRQAAPNKLYAHSRAVAGVAVSNDADRVASVSMDGMLKVWRISTSMLDYVADIGDPILDVEWVPDEHEVAIALADARYGVSYWLLEMPRTLPVVERTNLRVCRSNLSVLPVMVQLLEKEDLEEGAMLWAPESLCQ